MVGGILKLIALSSRISLRHFSVLVLVLSLALTPRFAFAQDCQQCSKGGEEGGGGGGGKASDVLFGLAAIMAAAAPMVAAAVQADADKQIAKTNANAQMAMTKMSADTSKYLADQQQEIAMGQAQIAADISAKNQQASTERLEMQLAELNVAREQAAALEDKKFAYQQQLDAERVALAKAQSEEASKVAAKQMRAQLTAAGMSQGFASSTNSAAGVPVSPTGGSTSIPQSSGNTSGYAVASNSATKTSSSAGVSPSAVKSTSGSTGTTLSTAAPSKKAAATTPKPSVSRGISTQSSSQKLVNSSQGAQAPENTLATASVGLQTSLTKNSLARGSTSNAKQNGKAKATDLDSFTKTVAKTTAPASSPQRGISSVSAASLEPATSWAPTYNPPTLSTGSGHRR